MLDTTNLDERPISLETLAMADLARQAREFAAKSKGAGTIRAYGSAWKTFIQWCEEHGVDHRTADPYTIANYVTARANDLSASSIGVMLAAIKSGYDSLGTPMNMQAPFLRNVVAGVMRSIGTRPARKVTAATPDILRLMIDARTGDTEAAGARDLAMFLIGLGAAMRRSEIVALRMSDVVEVPRRGLRILIRQSKTDKFGTGREVAVAANPTDSSFCPVVAVNGWLKHRLTVDAGPEDALFCGLSTHGGRVTGKPLTDQAVMRAIKRAAEAAGLPAKAFSGHSLRRGFMTAAAGAGASLQGMMCHSRHKSTSVALGYIEEAGMWDDNVSDLVFSGSRNK